jgi:phage FluMu protein Com
MPSENTPETVENVIDKSPKVDAITTWNDEDELGERVVRYNDVRCPECGRMLFCIRWEATGWPEVHCPPCGVHEGWPFEETQLRERYENPK